MRILNISSILESDTFPSHAAGDGAMLIDQETSCGDQANATDDEYHPEPPIGLFSVADCHLNALGNWWWNALSAVEQPPSILTVSL
jgi:hypothetical protein